MVGRLAVSLQLVYEHVEIVCASLWVQKASTSCCLPQGASNSQVPSNTKLYVRVPIFRNTAIMCGVAIFNQVRGSVALLPSYRAHSHYALLVIVYHVQLQLFQLFLVKVYALDIMVNPSLNLIIIFLNT